MRWRRRRSYVALPVTTHLTTCYEYEAQLSRSLRPLQTTRHTAATATQLLQSITVLLLWQWRELAQSPAAITFSLVLCCGRFFTVDYSSGEFNITHGCSTRNFRILSASGHFAICALSCLPAAPVIVVSRRSQGPPEIATWILWRNIYRHRIYAQTFQSIGPVSLLTLNTWSEGYGLLSYVYVGDYEGSKTPQATIFTICNQELAVDRSH